MKSKFLILSALVALAGFLPQSKAALVSLGSAGSFAVLGGSTVTSTGFTVLYGNLGVSPGLAITGFPPGIVNGTTYAGGAVALQAQDDAITAYNTLAGSTSIENLSGQDLGGLTLVPGVRNFTSSAQLTGTLTLDAQNNPDAVWIFQAGSTLTTALSSSVVFKDGIGDPCNVFWQVGSSATLGTSSAFVGTIMALTSITANTGATVDGRLLARNGAVTLDDNTITVPICVPEASAFWPLAFCASVFGAGQGFAVWRRKLGRC